ncbi:MAG TPA: glycosyl hydrolase, partial [Blastocatellia bacterium]|nr:glycosyl hydrolase [Blastocatellia bacterium]
PNNPNRMIEGNDGGATISVDGGATWSTEGNQPTAQFYHVVADNRFPYYVYGAQQDNSTIAIASAGTQGAIDPTNWYAVGGGESGYIAPDPNDPNIVYSGGYEGEISRYDRRTDQAREITPWPMVTDGLGAAGLKHRWQWTSPIVVSPHNPNRLYYGGEVLFETTDGGTTWNTISPDLTRNDKTRQQVSGGPITKDDTGTEYYDTIFTIAESPVQAHLIWVGTDDGVVQVTQDDGKTWSNVTPKDLPEWSRISLIEASPFEAGTAYVAINRYQNDDLKPYIYKTSDFGKSWSRIDSGIPEGSYVRAVREDPVKKGLLYAGTEHGVFVSFDDGAHWHELQLNLPRVPVHDLIVKNDDLVAATHGRSFWILDDITPLRHMTEQAEAADFQLFAPRVTWRTRIPSATPHGPLGQNPPAGAIVYYYLKTEPKTVKGADGAEHKEEITLEIQDTDGKLIRKYSSIEKKTGGETPSEDPFEEKPVELLPAEAGLNRFVWDMRYERVTKVPGGEAVFSDYQPRGPMLMPGKFQLKMTAGGKSQIVPLELKLDPRITVSVADLRRQFDFGLKLRGRINDAQEAINQMLDLRAQITDLKKRLGDDESHKPLIAVADALDKKINAVEEELFEPKIKASEDSLNYPIKLRYKLVALAQVVDSADAAPTQASYQLFDELSAQLDKVVGSWHDLTSKDLAEFNDAVKKASVPALWVQPPHREP